MWIERGNRHRPCYIFFSDSGAKPCSTLCPKFFAFLWGRHIACALVTSYGPMALHIPRLLASVSLYMAFAHYGHCLPSVSHANQSLEPSRATWGVGGTDTDRKCSQQSLYRIMALWSGADPQGSQDLLWRPARHSNWNDYSYVSLVFWSVPDCGCFN